VNRYECAKDAKENNSTSETIKMDDCETDDMQKKMWMKCNSNKSLDECSMKAVCIMTKLNWITVKVAS